MANPFFDLPPSDDVRHPLHAGWASADISPTMPVPLSGVLDDTLTEVSPGALALRVLLFRQGPWHGGLVQLDLPHLPMSWVQALRRSLAKVGGVDSQALVFTVSQTPYAPEVRPDFPGYRPAYFEQVERTLIEACRIAASRSEPIRIQTTETEVAGPANRRYYLEGLGWVSCPEPGDPRIRRVEGPVDSTVGIVRLVTAGGKQAMLVNAANYVGAGPDTAFSADWPGRLARRLQAEDRNLELVIPLIGAAGNLYHLDATQPGRRYAEAHVERYSRDLAEAVRDCQPQLADGLHAYLRYVRRDCRTSAREFTPDEISDALDDSRSYGSPAREPRPEDHAAQQPETRRYLADAIMRLAADRGDRHLEVACLCLGELRLVCLPGRPFMEIGQRVRREVRGRPLLVISSGSTDAGYIALPEHYRRGGHEVTPAASPISTTTADYLMETVRLILRDVAGN